MSLDADSASLAQLQVEAASEICSIKMYQSSILEVKTPCLHHQNMICKIQQKPQRSVISDHQIHRGLAAR